MAANKKGNASERLLEMFAEGIEKAGGSDWIKEQCANNPKLVFETLGKLKPEPPKEGKPLDEAELDRRINKAVGK